MKLIMRADDLGFSATSTLDHTHQEESETAA